MKQFQKTNEDFRCDRCSTVVHGSGYTNHCPVCLWSKHVDIYPGDRKEMCRGLMKPISVSRKKDRYVVTHQCILCKFERKNKFCDGDCIEVLIDLSQKLN